MPEDSTAPDEEFRLAPIEEDEELGFADTSANEPEKIVAPEPSLDTTERLIPVTCSACKTRMYAGEDQIGMWKRCPDCERLTEIRYVEPKFRYVVEIDESGGYSVRPPEVTAGPERRINVDYSKESLLGEEAPEYVETRSFGEQQPKLEKMLQSLLDSKEEKEKARKEKEFRERVDNEIDQFRRERNSPSSGDPLARLIAEKEGSAYERNSGISETKSDPPDEESGPLPLRPSPSAPPKKTLPKPPQSPAPVPVPPRKNDSVNHGPSPSGKSVTEKPTATVREKRSGASTREWDPGPTPFWPGIANFLEPFYSAHNRKKLFVLFIFGLIANFCLEKVMSIIVRATLDSDPGKMISWGEMGILGFGFFLGGFFGVVWFVLVLMFSISILVSTSSGKIKVKNWVMFDLHLGISYVFWTALILFVSGYPGIFLIWGIEAFHPMNELPQVMIKLAIFLVGVFVTFPILFLCVTETDTFFGGWPKKTLGSLVRMPLLWVKFFTSILIFATLPVALLLAWLGLTLDFQDSWWIQSIGYYLTIALLKTLLWGFFPLIYFRFLGRVSWVISQEYPKLIEADD